MPIDPPAPVLPAARPVAATSGTGRGGAGGGDRIAHAARQFDAVFMTEMLRQARPANAARGRFAVGQAEKSWQMFMDQAIGEAASAKGGSGLVPAIEKSLRAAGGAAPRAPHSTGSQP